MESLIEQLMVELREEQAGLERQLQCRPDAPGPAPAGSGATITTTLNARQVRELSVNFSAHTEPAAMEEPLSLRERMAQLESLKRKYQRRASKAMNHYFAAVSGSASGRQRRATPTTPKPFPFETRELMRPTRIRDRRAEEDRQRREEEERERREARFTATPVPPTTFMNKYDLMVEEWCARKAAAELRARAVADAAREEAAFVRRSAEALRHTREELMGAAYDPVTGRPLTRAQVRARSAERAGPRRGVGAMVTPPEEVPLEVRMRLWPAIEEHERVRRERILHLARVTKRESDEFFKTTMPLLSSPTPHPAHGDPAHVFGIGQPVAQPPSQPPAQALAPPVTVGQPVGLASVVPMPMPVPLPVPVPVPVAVPALPAAAAPTVPPTTTTAPTTSPPPITAQVAPAAAPPCAAVAVHSHGPRGRSRSRTPTRDSKLTFQPRVRPGVPDFKELWAADRVELLERKKRRPPTTVQPFALAPSAKDGLVRGKPVSRAVSQPPPPRRTPSVTGPVVPKGTKAHALRTEAVYARYLGEAAKVDSASAGDVELQRERRRRQREVARRLGAHLPNTRTEHEAAIRAKVRALRAAARETEAEAARRLAEMRARVAQMPPLFAEPTGLNDASRARAAAEQEVAGLLQRSGLDAAVIRDILTHSGTGGDDGGDTVGLEGGTEAAAPASPAEAPTATTPTAAVPEPAKRTSRSGSRTSSSSSSGSSSVSSFSSSSSTSTAAAAARASRRGSSITPTAPVPVPLAVPVPVSPQSSLTAASTLASPPGVARSPALPVPVVAPVPRATAATVRGDYDDDSFESSSSGSG